MKFEDFAATQTSGAIIGTKHRMEIDEALKSSNSPILVYKWILNQITEEGWEEYKNIKATQVQKYYSSHIKDQ